MHPAVCHVHLGRGLRGPAAVAPDCARQSVGGDAGIRRSAVEHVGNSSRSPEEVARDPRRDRAPARPAATATWTGRERPLDAGDCMVVTPYNLQAPSARGRRSPQTYASAPSTASRARRRRSSSSRWPPRAARTRRATSRFLFSRNRLNVAISRARCLAYLVCAPALLETHREDARADALISTLCALSDVAGEQIEARARENRLAAPSPISGRLRGDDRYKVPCLHGRRKIAARTGIAIVARSERARLAPVTEDSTRTGAAGRPARRAGLVLRQHGRRRHGPQGPDGRHEAVARGRLARSRAFRRAHPRDARRAARARRVPRIRRASRSPSTPSSASTRRSASSAPPIPTWTRCAVEVRELHLAACRAVPPKPEALAARLVELAEKTEHDWMQDAPERYRELLGDDGLAALDTILTRKLDAMPPDSRARALAHRADAARDERVARSRARRHRPPRARARTRSRDARALRAHRPRARCGRRAATTRSSGCSAVSPRTAPPTTTLREALVIAYLHADRRGGCRRAPARRAHARTERAADGRAARRCGRRARRRARLGARAAHAGGRARRRCRRARHGAARRRRHRCGTAGRDATAGAGAGAARARADRGRRRSRRGTPALPAARRSRARDVRIARATAAPSATCARCARPRRPTGAATRSSRSPAPRARSTRAAARSSRCSTSSAGGSRRRRCRRPARTLRRGRCDRHDRGDHCDARHG